MTTVSERQEQVLRLLRIHGQLSVDELAHQIGVSRETIRRDLNALNNSGALKKFHGGASVWTPNGQSLEAESPLAQRMAANPEGKRRIALAAKDLFSPNDSLFIDTGSTTIALADELAALDSLTIITNSPRIASTVAAGSNHRIFLIGGAYNGDVGESLGPLAIEQINKFRATHAVITVGAIDGDCVMDFDLQEAELAKAMIARADKTTVLVDHSKFNRRAVFEVAKLSEINTVVTDASPPANISTVLNALGAKLICASS